MSGCSCIIIRIEDFEAKISSYVKRNDSSWLNDLMKEISDAADDLEKRVADPLPHEVEAPVCTGVPIKTTDFDIALISPIYVK